MSGRTVLLVIDTQVAMFDPSEPPFEGDRILANIKSLVDRARAAGTDVLYVRHEDPGYEPMQRDNPGWHVHPSIAPADGEAIFDKVACDSFYGTGLEAALREREVDRIVIAGFQTEMCVDTACRSALHRDFNVTLAADGHGTWDIGNRTAEMIIAHHNKTLGGIPHPTRKITVKPSAEIEF